MVKVRCKCRGRGRCMVKGRCRCGGKELKHDQGQVRGKV